RCYRDWSSDVCSSDLALGQLDQAQRLLLAGRHGVGEEAAGLALSPADERRDCAQRVAPCLEVADRAQALEMARSVEGHAPLVAEIGRASCRGRVWVGV